MTAFKNIMFVLLGIVIAVGVACATVAIGCAINGVSFGQQIVNWFGTTGTATESVVSALAI